MKKALIILAAVLISAQAFSQEVYKASLFGVKSNGVIDNTSSIQRAVDFIAQKGGGTLVFNVGRYLTGAIELKSGVNIRLNEGAVIVGSDNIHAYRGQKAVFYAENAENISIFGKGVIEGQGPALLESYKAQAAKGYLPAGTPVPSLVSFTNCTKASLKDFILRYPATTELYLIDGGDVKVSGCYTDVR